jgi:hypothetical protein
MGENGREDDKDERALSLSNVLPQCVTAPHAHQTDGEADQIGKPSREDASGFVSHNREILALLNVLSVQADAA